MSLDYGSSWKLRKWKPMNTDANFLGKREELYISIHIDVGGKARFKYVNSQQNLFPFTHDSPPASTGATICPKF